MDDDRRRDASRAVGGSPLGKGSGGGRQERSWEWPGEAQGRRASDVGSGREESCEGGRGFG
jgi:hypothetical protein